MKDSMFGALVFLPIILILFFSWILYELNKLEDYENECYRKGGVVMSQFTTDVCIKAEFLLPRNEMF